MFTGIIQALGSINEINLSKNIYSIKTILNLDNCSIGSSICCDGICLTATKITKINQDYFFEVNIGEETIRRSNAVDWKFGTIINIEKSLRIGDEISGHFVYGHVDTSIILSNIIKLDNSWEFEFSYSDLNNITDFRKYIVEKGSVAVNGISLTIANIFKNSFNTSIIPHTYDNTNLSFLKIGNKVNIEFDPLSRYMSNNYEK